jgi:hypothetical protein
MRIRWKMKRDGRPGVAHVANQVSLINPDPWERTSTTSPGSANCDAARTTSLG